ncbi:MAG: Crp/Fnr family transcriptional regulator [Bacteroidota bacterium]
MKQFSQAISYLIQISDLEMQQFAERCYTKVYKRKEYLSQPRQIPQEVFFIEKGLLRMIIHDREGNEHTTHFALENQFIADYSSFMQQKPGIYYLEALEETRVVVLPRPCVEWGYQNLQEGEKLGRLIAEFYFIYHDQRLLNQYARSPKERYDEITQVFPNIHNRVPQRMIASYLGITPVHLSRLKKSLDQKT